MKRLRAGADLEVGYKDARANLVTAADREAQRAVTAMILATFPRHLVNGEEGTAGDPGSSHVWYVDPLDGTTNYAHGIPFFCVSVALRAHGRTVAGAVYDPLHDELYAGGGRGRRDAERGAAAGLLRQPAGPFPRRRAGADGRPG